jgi:hypothetical protein
MNRRQLFHLAMGTLMILFFVAIAPCEGQESAPTLEETNRWLKEKISSAAFVIQKDSIEHHIILTFEHKVTPIKINDCDVVWRETRTTDTKNDSYAMRLGQRDKFEVDSDFEISFRLSDIDPQNVAVEKKEHAGVPPYYWVILKTFSDNKLVRYRNLKSDSLAGPVGKDDYARLVFTEQDMADRIAKALIHAIKLCKGKKEPF